jgi:hypothetical protein
MNDSFKLCVFVAVIGVLFNFLPLACAREQGTKPAWRISGQLEEACTCAAACPCWFNSKPTQMTCGGGQVLFIKKGSYGDVRLDGLAVANFGKSPEGETMMGSFGNWKYSYLYIDEKANEAQRKALKEIGSTILPLAASTKTEIRYVPITRQMDRKEHKITIGQYGTFEGHLIEGGLGGVVKIKNPPGADPLHHEYEQGLTTKLVYNDAGDEINTKNSNYMRANFNVNSAQYEKFNVGLSQKMAEMKKQKESE